MKMRENVALAPGRRDATKPEPGRFEEQILPDDLHSAMRQFDGCTVLVTGGTGSFGQRFIETLLRYSRARRLIIF
jgi:hypothetical protein